MKGFKLILLFVVVFSAELFANSSLDSAKSFYDKGDYASALKIYDKRAVQYPSNFEVQYNLGNAYYKTGNKGLAILSYEKALQIKPGDEDTKHNLELLQTQLSDKFEEMPSIDFEIFFRSINQYLSYNFLGVLALLFMLSSVVLVFLAKKKKQKIKFSQSWLLIFISLFLFLWANVQKNKLESGKHAIITAYETEVLTAPNEQAILIFKLHEGTKLNVLEQNLGWISVKAPDGNVGWVKKETVGVY